MSPKSFLGEFEQMVLLAMLARGNDATGLDISDELDSSAGRSVSRGALYTTLDRLGGKGFVEWKIEPGDIARSGLPRRHFSVTPEGIVAVRQARDAFDNLTRAAAPLLDDGKAR